MHFNKIIKKQVTLSIFSFVIISLIIVGTSTAILLGTTNSKTVTSKVGNLVVNYTMGNTITINTDPMIDSKAISASNNVYEFTVKNAGNSSKGNVPYSYKVYLVNNGSTLDTRYIKYCLITGNSSFSSSTCTGKYLSTSSTFSSMVLTSRTNLTAGASQKYKLKIWVGTSGTNGAGNIPNSAMGKNVKLNIKICGQAGTSLSNITVC